MNMQTLPLQNIDFLQPLNVAERLRQLHW